MSAARVLAIWMVAAALFTTQSYYYRQTLGQSVTWLSLWWSMAYYSLLWAMFTPLILWLSRRFRVNRTQWISRIFLHLVFAAAIAVVHRFLLIGTGFIIGGQPIQFGIIYNAIVGYGDYGVYIYLIILFVDHAGSYYRQYHEEQIHAAQLKADLSEAQLQSLQMQLQPHFLFNTLNAITVLIKEDPDAAALMIKRLSDLLRLTLEQADTYEVPLRSELEFLDHYLVIEQIRFGDRLTVTKKIDQAAMETVVPYLILQPLVENALHHGIGTIPGPGRVEISAEQRNGTIQLSVQDTGSGVNEPPVTANHHGLGLTNTRARLRQLYGDSHTFEMQNVPGGGVKVTISFPSHHE